MKPLTKEVSNFVSERAIEKSIQSENQAYNIKYISKGVVHSLIIPILLGYFTNANIAWGYLFFVTILYATVFKNTPSARTFFIIIMPFVYFAILVIPVVWFYK